jgi:hypothetical protein
VDRAPLRYRRTLDRSLERIRQQWRPDRSFTTLMLGAVLIELVDEVA